MKQDLAVAGLLHDLNNVLQTVAHAAGILAEDPKWVDLAATLSASVDRGRSILESVSEAPVDFDLRTVIERAAAAASLPVAVDVEAGLCITGRPRAFERIFANLFENSAAAGAAGIEVTGSFDAVRVTDDGSGIPADVLPSLFEPGVSGRGSTGLGLHIVDTIVREHGCRIEVPHCTRGAIFTIHLPIKQP